MPVKRNASWRSWRRIVISDQLRGRKSQSQSQSQFQSQFQFQSQAQCSVTDAGLGFSAKYESGSRSLRVSGSVNLHQFLSISINLIYKESLNFGYWSGISAVFDVVKQIVAE